MEYQQLLIAFCFYSLFVHQSQLTYARKHLCTRDEAFYLLQLKQGLTVDKNAYYYGCDSEAEAKTLSWNATRDCCEWGGVTCNGLTGHVIGLDLSCSFLIGTINANNSLTKLGHLQRLNLALNVFNDFPLGNSISELSSLTHLNLSDSGIFNERKMIPPGLCKLSKLISLDLSGSYIQVGRTTFTSLLHNLTNLEVLLFDDVYASFELPKKFPSSLRKLSLQGTNMFGNITDSQLFRLPNLQVLGLGDNPSLTGTLPNFHWNFSKSVLELDFSYTGIFGKVPDSIGILRSLWRLNLFNCHLSGSIPESFGNLTTIRELILSGNNFTGNILSTISKLNKLVNLHLSSNHFRGSIPESIGNLTAIRELILSDNSFTGNVPSSIGKLNKLDSLSLSSNNFEGSIPDIFANFSELNSLDFHSNNFVGPFPYSIATLTHLDGLELQNNSLTGPLPSNISGFQNLFNLDLSFNYLTGATPPWLFQLPSLMSLSVQANKFTGELPNELNMSSSVPFIDISYNNLHGEIPYWMLFMSIDSLDLSHNFLTGFEKQVWHSEYLSYLNLENNLLQGPLHQSICDLINLAFLILAQNNFNGSIPDCLGLQYLGLYGNQLRGQVPRSLVNCTSLVALDLGNNKFNDTFPIWLEKLPNLQVLILKSNLFHGPIGDLESEFPFPELRIFDLSFNGFTGTLSSNLFKSFRGMMDVDEGKAGISRSWNGTRRDYFYHVSLVIKGNEFDMRITSIMTSVDLSSNRFEGDIPISVGNLRSLVLLNLSHNSFRGHIPAEFTKLQQLEALDLSWNRLIGEIPGQLSSLTFLEVLNLSYNHLAGRIPIGKQFNTFPNDSYCGNPDLCGFPLSKECGNRNEHDDDDDSYFMSGFTWEAVAIGYGCGMIFGLLIGGLMFLLQKPKWYVKFAEDIAQQIAAKKRKRQKKRRQKRGLSMN
ncbi:receptor-like protein Cf-9 isoform X2 [Solanum lycopersicum]|uniref:receptor-like protein Cf-9 isoform X2 n=1 Tax=Solanum lycopersicum TaxID=4081 RepID=UPI000532F7E8|nr:receptor-like protein 9DC3 isoform X2 [Solanum lycopersicum]